ncbi:MAG: hypothetical protein ACI8R4_001905 [Paracoccaceae bacterium]|jgi:hypothetical protein
MIRSVIVMALVALGLGASSVAATAPEQSPRPPARAAATPNASPNQAIRPHTRPAPPVSAAAPKAQITAPHRPQARPVSDQMLLAAARPSVLSGALPGAQTLLAPDTSARPWARPDSVVQEALFGRRKKRKGSVCGDIEIQGEKIDRIPAKLKGCGLKNGVRVRSVSGVALSTPASLDCTTAKALNEWVRKSLKPTFRRRGPVVEISVAAHYTCRTRNNRPGAKISEHGRGKAIDISGFTMMDGEVITVLKGWGQGTTRKPLHQIHKAACGPFGTVLGPNADSHHRDHFHFDTAQHRGGPYCR